MWAISSRTPGSSFSRAPSAALMHACGFCSTHRSRSEALVAYPSLSKFSAQDTDSNGFSANADRYPSLPHIFALCKERIQPYINRELDAASKQGKDGVCQECFVSIFGEYD